MLGRSTLVHFGRTLKLYVTRQPHNLDLGSGSAGAVDHAFASLRPCKHTGAQLDKWNNKFVGRILKLHKPTHEAVDAFVIRKNAQIAREKLNAKLDVKLRWCLKCVTWGGYNNSVYRPAANQTSPV